MQLYAILRRSGWDTTTDLEEAAERSARVGNEEMPDRVRWIRTYALGEEDGKVGTICIYEGESPEAIREHASRAFLLADEVVPIGATLVVRPDPAP